MIDNAVKGKNRPSIHGDSIAAKIRSLRAQLEIDQTQLAEDLGVSQGTVSEWEKGDHAPPPIALMAIGRLDKENTMWWYEQAGARFAERLKMQQLIRDVRAKEGRATIAPRHDKTNKKADRKNEPDIVTIWDPDMLVFVIETLNGKLKERRLKLPDSKYAQAVVLCYEFCRRLGNRDVETVEKFLSLVA